MTETSVKIKSTGPRLSIIPAAFICDPRPTLAHFRVFCLLGRHTDEAGWCVRSQVKMAGDLGISRETVNRCIRDLCEWGFLEKTDQGLSRSVCHYRVILDPRKQPEVVETASDVEITSERNSDPHVTGGCDVAGHRGVISHVTPITTLLNDTRINEVQSAGARQVAPVALPEKRWLAEHNLRSGEAAFDAWIEQLRKAGQAELAERAISAGILTAPSRWPKAGSPMPRVAKPPEPSAPASLSMVSKRIVGEE